MCAASCEQRWEQDNTQEREFSTWRRGVQTKSVISERGFYISGLFKECDPPARDLFPGLAHTQWVLSWVMDSKPAVPQNCLRKGPKEPPKSCSGGAEASQVLWTEGSEVFFGGTDTQWNRGQAFRHIMVFKRFLGFNFDQLCQISRDLEEQRLQLVWVSTSAPKALMALSHLDIDTQKGIQQYIRNGRF